MASKLNIPERRYREFNEPRAEPKNRRRNLILAIVSGVLLLGAGAGGAAWYFTRFPDGAMSEKKPPVFVNLETFTVNLQSEHSDQHLQTNLTLKVEDSSKVDLIKLHMPEVRDRILLLLSSKTAAQIATVEGKKKLAAEVAVEINDSFSKEGSSRAVESVLFTSFVIQ
ncbi:MAG TPA: flagellar basal body-associated protein FliL [Nitrosospira sp.]|nr:flagellar basal body-associated protein FliL [Nitrosospira sp.]